MTDSFSQTEEDKTSMATAGDEKRCDGCEWLNCARREHGCGCGCHITAMIEGQAKLDGVRETGAAGQLSALPTREQIAGSLFRVTLLNGSRLHQSEREVIAAALLDSLSVPQSERDPIQELPHHPSDCRDPKGRCILDSASQPIRRAAAAPKPAGSIPKIPDAPDTRHAKFHSAEFERGVMSRFEWTDALHATYFALFKKQAPESMKACDISHAIVDFKLETPQPAPAPEPNDSIGLLVRTLNDKSISPESSRLAGEVANAATKDVASIEYPCGCNATGSGNLPLYCPTHNREAEPAPACEAPPALPTKCFNCEQQEGLRLVSLCSDCFDELQATQ